MNQLKHSRSYFGFVTLLCYLLSGCSTPTTPTPETHTTVTPALSDTHAPTPTRAPYPLASPLAPPLDATPSFIMPACAPQVTPVSIPTQLPTNFPWPRKLQAYRVLTLNQDTANAQWQITALAPLNLTDAARFIFDALPKANYQVLFHEEEPTESEGLFRGNGWRGSWRINTILNCEGATTWVVILVKL